MKRVAITSKEKGVWKLRWTLVDPNGKRHFREMTIRGVKKTAEDEAFKIEREINSGTTVYQSDHTLRSWLEWWLDNVVGNRRPETLEHYREQVRYVMDYPIANVQIKKLTAMMLTEFFISLRKRKSRYGGTLSSRSVDHVWSILNNALNSAERLEQIAANPMRKVVRERTAPVRETRALTEEEFAAYVRAADLDTSAGPLVHLALDTGFRREDLAGLVWSAVDLERRVIEIKEVLVCTKETGLLFQPPKTEKGKRVVHISQKTANTLRDWRKRQALRKEEAGADYEEHGLVFPRMDGRPGTPTAIFQKVRQFQKRHGLPQLRLHELRHTAITNTLAAGFDPKAASVRAGHSKTDVTLNIYRHVRDGEQREMGGVYDRLTGYTEQSVPAV